jgi:putative ABC transport system substrate-binding protein
MICRTLGLLVTLALGLLVAPLAAEAQSAGKVPRIGLLIPGSASDFSSRIEAFRQGMRELGYIEGQNLAIEYRWTEGKSERLPGLAAELVRLNVDVMLTGSTPGALAAKEATQTIPVVIWSMGDAVGRGVVASLARPGGNITGLSFAYDEAFSGKWVELLKEAVPRLSRVAVLWDPTNRSAAAQVIGIQSAALALGLMLQFLELRDPNALEHAFAAMSWDRAEALIVTPDPPAFAQRTQIAALAAKSRLPTMHGLREYVDAGGLMSYGASDTDMFRRAATYVDKILKGAKPADLPVEQPMKFELVINLKTAEALGLTIPPTLLLQADEVIR